MKKKLNAIQMNQFRCLTSIILSVSIIILVFITLLIRINFTTDYLEGTKGLGSFKTFTILSNVFVAIVASFTIPYNIDGFRTGNYHLPKWVINSIYIGVSSVAATFLLSLSILSPIMGFKYIMIDGICVFAHTLTPIISIIFFIFTNSYHHIKLKMAFIATIPQIIYLAFYMIMVFAIGEENGGWNDFYEAGTYLPWPLVCALAVPLLFLICFLLRMAHNQAHKIQKQNIENYYLTNDDYNFNTIEEAILYLANINKKKDNGGDLNIPRRIIIFLMKRYDAKENLEYYVNVYIKDYYVCN